MRILTLLVLTFFWACGQSPTPPASAPTAATSGLHFQFSTAPLVTGNDERNLCQKTPPEAQAIYADPIDTNRRYFALNGGMCKVVVDVGTTMASFFLLKKGDTLEVFTSDQFPECLSSKTNFELEASGTRFRYNNQRHIDFGISTEQVGGVLRIWIDMPVGSHYGLSVRRG